ncbi:hypothetical protein L5559_006039 [Pseudomonas aeruginosa]|nr:hypothetical protein [Pseudomonas aeruginosa]EKU2261338.1 hypothetical protein [Pseudomonas aeruginosa]EKU7770895.1 hypothetical protein [Pseudomonas aeruginosa]EKU7817443.1 hypothetical protein [Pseudomonas aeruginosa]EKW0514778.1 hypothetical protein [Pseudomonas aeruginosa]
MLEYYLNGIEGRVRPVGSSLISFFKNVSLFLKFAGAYVECLSEISEFLCMQYVNYLKNRGIREILLLAGFPIPKSQIDGRVDGRAIGRPVWP